MDKFITWFLTILMNFGMWLLTDIWHVVIFTGIILGIIAIAGLIKNA